jgi:hypothetical protein
MLFSILKQIFLPRPLTRKKKKKRGLKYCRYAGYGFKWSGPKGQQKRVPDEGEQAVMSQLVQWRDNGASWYQMAARLLRNRIVTSEGREWSPSRCRRAFLAALRLRADATS